MHVSYRIVHIHTHKYTQHRAVRMQQKSQFLLFYGNQNKRFALKTKSGHAVEAAAAITTTKTHLIAFQCYCNVRIAQ